VAYLTCSLLSSFEDLVELVYEILRWTILCQWEYNSWLSAATYYTVLASKNLRSVEWWSFTDVAGQRIGSIFKGQEVQWLHWTSWPLKMGPIRCPKTLVKDYHSTLRNTPEERISQHRGGSLKSLKELTLRCQVFFFHEVLAHSLGSPCGRSELVILSYIT
jgi:hypothetical protein